MFCLGLELTNKLNTYNKQILCLELTRYVDVKVEKLEDRCMKQFYILFIDVSKVDPVDLGTRMLKGLYY